MYVPYAAYRIAEFTLILGLMGRVAAAIKDVKTAQEM